jgi:dTDP-glucose 4,6-dehydratase
LILITGGAGFIGSNFILQWLAARDEPVVNLDNLTYAGNLRNLDSLRNDARHIFVRGDIDDAQLVPQLLRKHQPRAVLNFAAESHVDRSILGPAEFVRTNIHGTFNLLEAARAYWSGLAGEAKRRFRFLQVSTDEVYGSLGPGDAPFRETTAYAPNSPYAASKAAADHMVRAYHHTYGLPTLTTNCSNNYGPLQFPEKLIPLVILNAVAGKAIPVYGDGLNVRDWLYVDDHCRAILALLAKGREGEIYNIGGNASVANIDVVHKILRATGKPESLIRTVQDRPGHDRRYALSSAKIMRETGWAPTVSFEDGLIRTVAWYRENAGWVARVKSGDYQAYYSRNYDDRSRQFGRAGVKE